MENIMRRVTNEILRSLEQRVARLEKQSVKDDPRVPKVGDIVIDTTFSPLTINTFYKVIEVGDSVVVKQLGKKFIIDIKARRLGGILVEPSNKWAMRPETYTSEEIMPTRVGYILKMRGRTSTFEKWDGKPTFEEGHLYMY